jgi:hypothetical protein
VRARQHADLRRDRPDGLAVAAVDSAAGLEDIATHDIAFEIVEEACDLLCRNRLAGQCFDGFLSEGLDLLVTRLLHGFPIGLAQIGFELLAQLGRGGADLRRRLRQRPRLLGALFGEVDDRVDDRPHRLVTERHGAQHDLLRQLLGLRFDHQDTLDGAGDDEVEVRVGAVLKPWIEDVLAIDIADAGGADRAEERNARDRQRGGTADHRDDIRVILQVVAQYRRDNLSLTAETWMEERPDRPVDQTRGQDLLLARPALALEEAAGDLARGEGLLLIVDCQREEVDAGLRRPLTDHAAQHDGIAVGAEHGAIGLTGDPPGLQNQLAPAPVYFITVNAKHCRSVLSGNGRS